MPSSRSIRLALAALGGLAAAGLLQCGGSDPATTGTADVLAATSLPSTQTVAASTSSSGANLAAANTFQLSQGDLHVDYSESAGGPVLVYEDATGRQTFRGNDVYTDSTPAGELVSVAIHRTIDSGSVTFSLLIPRVRVRTGTTTPVLTEGITAVHQFSVVPSDEPGQLDQYDATPLEGTAGRSTLEAPSTPPGIAHGSPPRVLEPNN